MLPALLGFLGAYGLNNHLQGKQRAALLGELPQWMHDQTNRPMVTAPVAPSAPTSNPMQIDIGGPQVTTQEMAGPMPGTYQPGSGLMATLNSMNPQAAAQLAPLLQQLPMEDLQAASRGLIGSMFEQPASEKPQIVEGADGFKYWATGPNAGQRVLPNVTAAPRDDKTFEHEQGLRKEFTNASKEFIDVTNSFTRINESVKDPSAAGDLALVFNYMKMLDPASVVRESEFATAQNAAGVPEIIRNTWNRLKSGERLGNDQRGDFFDRARRLYEGAMKNQARTMERYQKLAQQYNALPENIVFDYTLPQNRWYQPGQSGAQVGPIPQPPPGFTEEVR